MTKRNEIFSKDSSLLQTDEQGRTHIEILGIDFVIKESVPVTDILLQILQDVAESNIRRPVLVSAQGSETFYRATVSDEQIRSIPPENRRKVVISGIETELLAISYDDTPIPVLTQEHAEQAAKKFWLHEAYVSDKAPGCCFLDPGDFVITFPGSITRCHQITSTPFIDDEKIEEILKKDDFPF